MSSTDSFETSIASNSESDVQVNEIPFILQGKYFKILKNDGNSVTAICQHCSSGKKNEYKGAFNGTSNFLKHLKRSHEELIAEYENGKVEDTKRRRLLPSNKSQTKISDIYAVDQKAINKSERLITNFVIKGVHPYSIVEEDGFKKLVNGLDSTVKSISRKTLVNRVDDKYNLMRKSLQNRLEGYKHICVTADAWTSKGKKRSFMGMTAHWINDDLTRGSAALACRRFKGSHTFDRIAELISQILHEYKIPVKQVVRVVTDNGGNFVKAFREFSGAEEVEDSDSDETDIADTNFVQVATVLEASQDDGPQLPPHLRCTSHTLSLMCTADISKSKASKLQTATFAKCQGIWNKISRSTTASEEVKSICNASLKTPVCTRWNSQYDSLLCLLKFEDNFHEICTACAVTGFKAAEVEFMKEYVKCVEPIAIGLDRMQGENNTYFGELLPTLISIKKQLEKLVELKLQYCERLPQLLLESLGTRFKSFLDLSVSIGETNQAVLAAISHPYFKLRWIPTTPKREELKQFFLDTLRAEFKTVSEEQGSQDSNNSDPSTVISKSKSKDDDFFDFPSYEEEPDTHLSQDQCIKEEFEAYLASSSTGIDMLKKYPTIKRAFVKYNTIIPSSAPVERLFNFSGMILSPKRQRLTDDHFEKLTLLKINAYEY